MPINEILKHVKSALNTMDLAVISVVLTSKKSMERQEKDIYMSII